MATDLKRVKEIFLAAAELADETARAAYLDRACGGDAELRARVEVLLRAHDPAGSFLGTPAAVVPAPDDSGTLALHSSDPDGDSPGPDAEDSDGLQFLTPPGRPDSLGRIGHYEVLQVLGKGGFGIVFRAFDEVLQRVVAIKMMSAHLAATSPPRKRFLREARSSAKIRHENVVQVYAVEEHPLPYLVMEFIPGETLQQRIDRTGPLETAEVVQIGRQIAEGLAAAHAEGLIHRDVKPANVLIEAGPNQHVKITDFGLARAADDASLTQSGTIAGTPMYMAPEQAHGDRLDHRADLFSLGSVLYTMASGRPPFRANNTLAVLKRVAEDTPRAISEIIPEVPQWLCDVIARLHAKNPEDRIGTAKEVADLLARGLAPAQGGANVPSLPIVTPAARPELPREDEAPGGTLELPKRAPAVRPRIRPRHWAAAAVLLVVLLGGFGLTEATGVTKMRGTVIQLFSPEGTLEIQVDDPDVSVQIDGSDLVITGSGVKEIRLKTGSYTVKGIKDGKEVSRDVVSVTKNGKPVVRVRQVAKPLAPVKETPEEKAARVRNAAAWERVVAGLSAADQVKAVGARLKQLNPGFDGQVTGKIENDVVKGLAFSTAQVSDVSPVRALTHLKDLDCSTPGKLSDLSPLKGLKLATLDVSRTQVSDLSPLRGMPLTSLTLHSCTQIRDLSPLKGLPLTTLNLSCCPLVEDLRPLKGLKLAALDLSATPVSDLSPLQGMPLTSLTLHGCGQIQDLTPLKGLPLTYLNIHDGPQVADFSPLKGMRLTTLSAGCNPVRDLSPLKGMPLTELGLGNCRQVKDFSPLKGLPLTLLYVSATQVSNLELLKGMPLKTLYVDAPGVTDLKPLRGMQLEILCLTPGNITQGLDVLRDMKSLQRIGLHHYQIWPAADFWERYDKGEFKK